MPLPLKSKHWSTFFFKYVIDSEEKEGKLLEEIEREKKGLMLFIYLYGEFAVYLGVMKSVGISMSAKKSAVVNVDVIFYDLLFNQK